MTQTPALFWASLLLALVFLIACSVAPTRGKAVPPQPLEGRVTQSGIASWYGPGFHGRATASGVIYDQHDLTAAHQTLPLGTRVMVVNLENGRSTEVVINDRGPFLKERVLDLSYAAATTLGMIGPGTIPVRIEVLDGGPQRVDRIRERLDYTLQLGSFADIDNARRLREQAGKAAGGGSEIDVIPFQTGNGTYYRVRLGTFSDRRAAEDEARRLARQGFPVIIMEK